MAISDPLKPMLNFEADDDEVPPPPPLTHKQEPIIAEDSSRHDVDHKEPGALESLLQEREEYHDFRLKKTMPADLDQNPLARASSFTAEKEDVRPPVPPKPSHEPGDNYKHVHPGMAFANEAELIASHPPMEGQHSQAQPQGNASADMQMPTPDSTKVVLGVSDVASSELPFQQETHQR